MILRKQDVPPKPIENCHDGSGILHSREMLRLRDKAEPGFNLIHDNTLEPGATIGEHTHQGTEEIYIVLAGSGTMIVDGQHQPIAAGDICLTRSGHSHGLINGDAPMHLMVVEVTV